MIWPCLPITRPVSSGLTEIDMLPGLVEICSDSGLERSGRIRKVKNSSIVFGGSWWVGHPFLPRT